MASPEQDFLVSTSLSPLYSQQPISVSICASGELPPPSNTSVSDVHPEHASFSTVLTTFTHGTIVLRLLYGGVIVELMSLPSQVTPIRFLFPAAVLPNVGLFSVEPDALHVLAVTSAGSLYRLAISLDEDSLWQNQGDGLRVQEHIIANFPEVQRPLVHVEGVDAVTIALPNASLLRLEVGSTLLGDDWSETIFHHGSFLSSLTSLLPMQSEPVGSGDIVSMASHPWPTDLGHVWTLSRDRTLRLWKAQVGCVASKSLSFHGRRHPSNPSSSTSVAKQPLLDASPQPLLRVFSLNERVYVLVFIPSASATSGGIFRLFDTYGDYLHDVSAFECSGSTVHSYLQDFAIHGKDLHTLWERQGRSTVESTELPLGEGENEEFRPKWEVASYINESELTPAYMEEQLLTPGSLTSKYLEALLRPGVFSSLTLKTAIDQYIDSCLSLPSVPPPQLSYAYTTVEEQIASIVGCTVNLNRDPQTGVPQHAAYWIALKRDWEGFIARCREIERSARWPLALGIKHQDVVIVERERIGLLVAEDLAIQLQRLTLNTPIDFDSQYNILPIISKLRSEVGPQVMSTVQNCIVDILHQEIPFSCSDVLQDQARRIRFRESLSEVMLEWLTRRLQSAGDLKAGVLATLDIIGGFDPDIKSEEVDDPSTSLIAENPSVLSTGLTIAYIATAISARYDLCLSLVTLLFFIADDLSTWDPILLGEVFAVFRGISMLRQIADQPTNSSGKQDIYITERAGSEDVIMQTQNMDVTHDTLAFRSSLIRLLLTQAGSNSCLTVAAHRFLDSTGLLRSVSPSNATPHEVLFCERVRLLGLVDVARDLLAWLPRTPGTLFVLASVWLQLDRLADSVVLLEKLASSFGPDCPLTPEDREALLTVIPSTRVFESAFTFYIYVSEIFKNYSLVNSEVLFAQLAISSAPPDIDTSHLWSRIIKGYSDLGRYDDAYAALMATPFDKQKRECVSQLVYQMCENNAIDAFMSFAFVGIVKEVEAALLFKTQNAEPESRSTYAHILYNWHVRRGNYRDGALVMYQQAQQLGFAIVDSKSFTARAELQLEAMMIAINALSLVVSSNAWILMPKSTSRLRGSDPQIVHLSDMHYQCTLLRAQIDLARRDPGLLSSQEFLLPPTLIVMRLAALGLYEKALTTARALKVDMTDIFAELVVHCLRLTSNSDDSMYQEQGDWLLTDQVASWSRSPAERGWDYLRRSLERHDSAETDYRYSKTVLESLLIHDQGSVAPPWLIQTLKKHQPEYLIRASLRYERVDLALEYSLSMVQKDKVTLMRESPRTAGATWLPYNLFDQVLMAAAEAEQSKLLPRMAELRTELSTRVQRVQKLSH